MVHFYWPSTVEGEMYDWVSIKNHSFMSSPPDLYLTYFSRNTRTALGVLGDPAYIVGFVTGTLQYPASSQRYATQLVVTSGTFPTFPAADCGLMTIGVDYIAPGGAFAAGDCVYARWAMFNSTPLWKTDLTRLIFEICGA